MCIFFINLSYHFSKVTNITNEIMEHFIKGFGLNQYINRLPDKENTIFNLFSDDISGGEKQIEKNNNYYNSNTRKYRY